MVGEKIFGSDNFENLQQTPLPPVETFNAESWEKQQEPEWKQGLFDKLPDTSEGDRLEYLTEEVHKMTDELEAVIHRIPDDEQARTRIFTGYPDLETVVQVGAQRYTDSRLDFLNTAAAGTDSQSIQARSTMTYRLLEDLHKYATWLSIMMEEAEQENTGETGKTNIKRKIFQALGIFKR